MALDPFADLASDLPDGAFWMTGGLFKRLLATLTADRVRPGANLDEHPTDKGRFLNAKSGGAAAVATVDPLTCVDASDADHHGRIRVYNGMLGGLRPQEMNLLDLVLPDGTDNHCYLTLSPGLNLVYGKVGVDRTSGLFTVAHVYIVASEEELDGDWGYLRISTWTFDGTTATKASQDAKGSFSLKVITSLDGSIIQPDWNRVA